jgi:hypothetical protein
MLARGRKARREGNWFAREGTGKNSRLGTPVLSFVTVKAPPTARRPLSLPYFPPSTARMNEARRGQRRVRDGLVPHLPEGILQGEGGVVLPLLHREEADGGWSFRFSIVKKPTERRHLSAPATTMSDAGSKEYRPSGPCAAL